MQRAEAVAAARCQRDGARGRASATRALAQRRRPPTRSRHIPPPGSMSATPAQRQPSCRVRGPRSDPRNVWRLHQPGAAPAHAHVQFRGAEPRARRTRPTNAETHLGFGRSVHHPDGWGGDRIVVELRPR
jgi:hypothetical protein